MTQQPRPWFATVVTDICIQLIVTKGADDRIEGRCNHTITSFGQETQETKNKPREPPNDQIVQFVGATLGSACCVAIERDENHRSRVQQTTQP